MKAGKLKVYRKRIKKVLSYIEENIQSYMSLSELAEISHFSDYHFHRIFKALVGESLKEHIRRVRLEKACHMFIFTDKNIAQIATATGFNSHESFIRAFRKKFGSNPSKGRAAIKKTVEKFLAEPHVRFLDGPTEEQYNSLNKLITIKQIEDIPVYYSRFIGSYSDSITLWLTMMNEIGSEVFFDKESQLIAVTHDIPGLTNFDKCRLDACIHTTKYQLQLQQKHIQGGLFAIHSYTHRHKKIEDAIDEIARLWLPLSGYVPRNEPVHYSMNSLWRSAEELSEPQIDIYVPIIPLNDDK